VIRSVGYAARWRRIWFGVIGLSLALSPVVVHPAAMIAAAAGGVVMAAIFTAVLSVSEAPTLPISLPRVGRNAAWGAGALGALVVVGTMSGTLMTWLLLAAVVSSPACVGGVSRAWARMTDAVGSRAPQLPSESTTRDLLVRLSSIDLCRAWRSTHRYLQDARSPEETAACARLRQLLFDELERRHPDAVAAWLATGAGAADGPERFLPSDRRDSSP
jgi:hypothetical protein